MSKYNYCSKCKNKIIGEDYYPDTVWICSSCMLEDLHKQKKI